MVMKTNCSISQVGNTTVTKVTINLVDVIIMVTQEAKEVDIEVDEEDSEVEEVVDTKEEGTTRTPMLIETIQISILEIRQRRNQMQPAENSLTTVISSAEQFSYSEKTNKIRINKKVNMFEIKN